MPNFYEEIYIKKFIESNFSYLVREAYPEEDHGYKKADLVIPRQDLIPKDIYLQVSKTGKSKKELKKLKKRGTYPISLYKFQNLIKETETLKIELESIIKDALKDL